MAQHGPPKDDSAARLDIEKGTADNLVLRASGDWVVAGLREVDTTLRSLEIKGARVTSLDFSGVGRTDTAGAWFLHRLMALAPKGTAISNADPALAELISEIAKQEQKAPTPPHRTNALLDTLARLGIGIDASVRASVGMLSFTGLILATASRAIVAPRRVRLTSVVYHIEQTGLNAVPIIVLINFLVGAVIAFLAADQLKAYGSSIFSVDLIAFAFLREFGVLLAAIMVAGRSGSAFTAEIGAMKGNEEIDAMSALGLQPVELLVLPRVLALIISLPLLTFIADMAGLFGGGVADWMTLGLTPTAFLNRLLEATAPKQFWVGMVKSVFFAFLIAMIGCYQGFKVSGSAESIGQRTTLSVVQAIFVVIVVDALFAVFFMEIHY